MAGTVVADKWQNGDGTENYKCRAWVNFNGTGTVAIRASGNVSSITDNGTGDYTVNFTTAMADSSYSYCIGHQDAYGGNSAYHLHGTSSGVAPTQMTTTAIRFGNSSYDSYTISVAIFR